MREILYWMFHMPCIFHLLTGWYCPGCGGTRAVKYLLQGKLLLSFQYHPLVLYMAAAVAAEIVLTLWGRKTGCRMAERWKMGRRRTERQGADCRDGSAGSGGAAPGAWIAYGGLAVMVVNWIVKNYLLLVRGIDLLSMPL